MGRAAVCLKREKKIKIYVKKRGGGEVRRPCSPRPRMEMQKLEERWTKGAGGARWPPTVCVEKG